MAIVYASSLMCFFDYYSIILVSRIWNKSDISYNLARILSISYNKLQWYPTNIVYGHYPIKYSQFSSPWPKCYLNEILSKAVELERHGRRYQKKTRKRQHKLNDIIAMGLTTNISLYAAEKGVKCSTGIQIILLQNLSMGFMEGPGVTACKQVFDHDHYRPWELNRLLPTLTHVFLQFFFSVLYV